METEEDKKGNLTTISSGYGSAIYVSSRESSTVLDDASLMVRGNYEFLVNEVIVSENILDQLKQSSLIDANAVQDIQSASTSCRKNDIIVKRVLSNENGSDACVRFLEIANNEEPGLTVELWKRLQNKKAERASQASSSTNLTWADVIKSKDLIIDEMNPNVIVDAMYESKDIRTSDHDSIIRDYSRPQRVNALLDIVSSRDDKRSFLRALESKCRPYLIRKIIKKKETSEVTTLIDVEEKENGDYGKYFNRIIHEFDGYAPEVKIVLDVDESVKNKDEIQTTVVRNTRRKQGSNSSEAQEMCSKVLNLCLDDVTSGSIILRLSSLSRHSLARFLNEAKKGRLTELIQVLLTESDVKEMLPKASVRISTKITMGAKERAVKCDEVTFQETDRTFRILLPYAVDRCHPQTLLDAFKKEEGIPKHFVGGIHVSSRKFNRRDSMLMMLQQVYRSGTFITKAVNNYLIQCFGANVTNVELSRCPLCTAQQIQNNYDFVISELDDKTMAVLNDIASFFGDSISMESTDRTPSRRMRAQLLLRDIMTSDKRGLDLVNILRMIGHGEKFPAKACSKGKHNMMQSAMPAKRKIEKIFIVGVKKVESKPDSSPDEIDLLTDFSASVSLDVGIEVEEKGSNCTMGEPPPKPQRAQFDDCKCNNLYFGPIVPTYKDLLFEICMCGSQISWMYLSGRKV